MAVRGSEWSVWRKSSVSGEGGCVEVRRSEGRIQVRDSKAPDGAVLTFLAQEWRAFIEGVHRGEFDLPDEA